MKECYHIKFDRFYLVTKFELPKVEYLKLTIISYDSTCQYLKKERVYNHIQPSVLEI